ncbi:hypothetical protein L1077_04920 [Pseudoalteromonas luteoviolacea]|uniref:Uncharacterized protein n=1 Tax=Pseudoalteromonas luteoviolacea H33 TaxID=1365251 RepID=A0A167DYV3_9GAMM|nr:hypothetical protein [Pseudoalteromonas luteoviolacea]KZN49768.1 hypothetical protein N476_18420 [Pseudoalteromonas luteoviolacea H33]KZN77792.1 hypothetical protein N477_00875 [Pseudoalteromonas luteoviolacea H33-S]MBQ4878725.1 hypothetical protein [Pseudoalteromonas luteoviolacea]MBQ4907867.1 hypothetical protein [Pseudoalteromonas luteoviolacea]MCF6438772.1 hypothetical protein [Pseudoalteromonas luteoviolacea]
MNIKVFTIVSALSLFSFESFAAMDLSTYQQKAYADSQAPGRCMGNIHGPLNWRMYIDYALQNGLITTRAANWGKATGYYPVINPFENRVTLICSVGRP